MLTIAVPIGLFIGLTLGALGGGGSILAVPALVYLLGQSPNSATTGSLLVVGVTALAGMAAHWRAGRVRVAQGLVFGALGVVGSYVGSRLSASVDPQALLAGFSVLMLAAAALMLRRRRAAGRPAGGDSAQRRRMTPGDAAKITAAATVVGLLTGFFGVGGGFIVVPALVLALGFEMPVAVGTSLLVIAVNSAVALGARLDTGIHVDWMLLGGFTLAAIAGSIAGNRVASRVDPARLTAAFIGLLVVVAAYTAARSVPALV